MLKMADLRECFKKACTVTERQGELERDWQMVGRYHLSNNFYKLF